MAPRYLPASLQLLTREPLPPCLFCSLPALKQARACLARLSLDDATLLALLNQHIKAAQGTAAS